MMACRAGLTCFPYRRFFSPRLPCSSLYAGFAETIYVWGHARIWVIASACLYEATDRNGLTEKEDTQGARLDVLPPFEQAYLHPATRSPDEPVVGVTGQSIAVIPVRGSMWRVHAARIRVIVLAGHREKEERDTTWSAMSLCVAG